MAEERPMGCGCFTTLLVLLAAGFVVIGGALAFGMLQGGEEGAAIVVPVVIAVFFAFLLWLIVNQRRSRQEHEAERDGVITSTGEGSVPKRSETRSRPETAPAPPGHPSSSDNPEILRTDPEDPESQKLKQRLAEAVSDLADDVEGRADSGRALADRPGSDEMIARAKRNIADRGRF